MAARPGLAWMIAHHSMSANLAKELALIEGGLALTPDRRRSSKVVCVTYFQNRMHVIATIVHSFICDKPSINSYSSISAVSAQLIIIL